MTEDGVSFQSRGWVRERTAAVKDSGKTFPAQVLLGKWSCFFFFQSDYIFSPDFILIVKSLLNKERARMACLLNLGGSQPVDNQQAYAIFIDDEMSAFSYEKELRRETDGLPWIFDLCSYICTSDVGEWCIYCEKGNDVAVIALRDSSSKAKFREPLQALHAETIENLLSDPYAAVFPFNQLVPSWAAGLLENYGDHA